MKASRSALPPDGDKRAAVRSMFDRIAARYDTMNTLLTFGRHRAWRRQAFAGVRHREAGEVLDVACGTGDFREIAQGAGHAPIGVDMSAGMLAAAHRRLPAIPLVAADALDLPFADARFDTVTCGFALRNLVSVTEFLDEAARVTRPGGSLVLVEVGSPRSRAVRWVHALWFERVVPVLGGLLSDREAYRDLPESVVWLPEPDVLESLLHEKGFEDVTSTNFMLGAARAVVAARSA